MTVDFQELHRVISIDRVTIAMRKVKPGSRVDQMQDVTIEDNTKKTTLDIGAKHDRHKRPIGLKRITTKQNHRKAVDKKPQKHVMQKIVEHCNKNIGTLYRVRWFGYKANDNS